MLTQEEVKKIFVYEPDKGALRRVEGGRKPYPWRKAGKGKYFVCTIGGETYYLHRLIWFYHHGYFPEMLDHIDNDQSNNRIENLRPCTRAENQYNSRRKVNNKSGAKGVTKDPRCKTKPWKARIGVDKKQVTLGFYSTVEEAATAYAEAAKRIAKDFARSDQRKVGT